MVPLSILSSLLKRRALLCRWRRGGAFKFTTSSAARRGAHGADSSASTRSSHRAVFFVISAFFVHRSFYGMRINATIRSEGSTAENVAPEGRRLTRADREREPTRRAGVF